MAKVRYTLLVEENIQFDGVIDDADTTRRDAIINKATLMGATIIRQPIQDPQDPATLAAAVQAGDPLPETASPQEYVMPIWAEENSTLGANAYEWAFGNGANSPADGGIRILVPAGWTCEIIGMSLQIGGGTATVRTRLNNTNMTETVTATGTGGGASTEWTTPVAVANNDRINFQTVAATGTSSPSVVAAFLRFNKVI